MTRGRSSTPMPATPFLMLPPFLSGYCWLKIWKNINSMFILVSKMTQQIYLKSFKIISSFICVIDPTPDEGICKTET
jgi:hypothetical protein